MDGTYTCCLNATSRRNDFTVCHVHSLLERIWEIPRNENELLTKLSADDFENAFCAFSESGPLTNEVWE